MADIKFLNGLIVKEHTFDNGDKIQKLAFNVDEVIQALRENAVGGWVNAVICKSQAKGTLYCKIDEWKKNNQQSNNQQQPQQNNSRQSPPQANDFPAMPNDMNKTKDEEEPEDIPF